jgi:hypothetical protein
VKPGSQLLDPRPAEGDVGGLQNLLANVRTSCLKGERIISSTRFFYLGTKISKRAPKSSKIHSAIFSKLTESNQLFIVQSIVFTIPPHRISGRRGETSLWRPCLSPHCGFPNNIHKDVVSLRQMRCSRKILQRLQDRFRISRPGHVSFQIKNRDRDISWDIKRL